MLLTYRSATVVFFSVSAVLFGKGGALASPEPLQCEIPAPALRVEATPFYSDRKGSIEDAAKKARFTEQLAPVHSLLSTVSPLVDRSPISEIDGACAKTILATWASADAMLLPPNNEGIIQRALYTVGIGAAVLKLKAGGIGIAPNTRAWLKKLIMVVIEDHKNRDVGGNVYMWSGAAAALLGGAIQDEEAIRYAEIVWDNSILQISPDGHLPMEVVRGRRALIYHQFAFSALSILLAVRDSLKQPPSQLQMTALKRLADYTGHAACDPSSLAASAQAPQEIPSRWAYKVISTFGAELLNAEWSRCGILNGDTIDIRFGGDLRRTLEALHHIRPYAK